jgi:anti-sigma regulatory factor (Ser/Thr protein kinase)
LRIAEHETPLPSGAMLALFTDGLVEHRHRDLASGIEQLTAELSAWRGRLGGAPEALVEHLLPEGPDDDVTILLARAREAPLQSVARPVAADRRAVSAARDDLARLLAGWHVPEELCADAVLVTSELLTNALLHGRPPVEINVRLDRHELYLEVFDRARAGPRSLRPTPQDEHGRGLQLVAALSSHWGHRTTRTGKCVWASFELGPPRGDASDASDGAGDVQLEHDER